MTVRFFNLLVLLAFINGAGFVFAGGGDIDFVWEGRLAKPSGEPYAGPVGLRLAFYHSPDDPIPVASFSQGLENVQLDEGVFQIRIPIPAAQYHRIFPDIGQEVFVQLTDLTHADAAPFPRQRLSVLPYAGKVPVDGVTLEFDSTGHLKVISVPQDAVLGLAASLTRKMELGESSLELPPYGTTTGATRTLRFRELGNNGSEFVGLKAPDSITSSLTWVLPATDGISGQVLGTNGNGSLQWVAAPEPIGTAGGDLSGLLPNPSVSRVGGASGKTATDIVAGISAVQAASAANTPLAIVQRDLNGGFSTGSVTVTASNPANQALIVKGATGQSTALQEWRDGADSVLSAIDSSGGLRLKAGATTFATLRANPSTASDITYTLPSSLNPGQYLTTDANGQLSWAAPSLGGGIGIVGITNGGTGASTAPGARSNLGAAASGANTDITSLSNLTSLTTSGNVGIGTATPENRLSVQGGANFTGNVGIGSASPTAALDVNGTVRALSFASPAGSANFSAQGINNVASLSIGTTTGGTDVFFGSGSDRAISVQASSTTGNNLILQAGGTSASGGDVNGGNLVLSSGSALGMGTSQIEFKTARGGNPATSMIISGSGNVGIGTSSPAEKLHINGNIRLEHVGNKNAYLESFYGTTRLLNNAYSRNIGGTGVVNEVASTPNSYIEASDGQIILATGAGGAAGAYAMPSYRLVVKNSGKIGIGTTEPSSALEIVESSPEIKVGTSDGGKGALFLGNSNHGLERGPTSYDANDVRLKTAGSGRVVISHESTDVAWFTASGNVGIGSHAPASKLDVNGTLNVRGDFSKGSYLIPFLESMWWQTGVGLNLNFDGTNFIAMGDNANNGAAALLSDYDGRLSIYTIPSNGGETKTITKESLRDSFTRLTISSLGNVGIGTASPTALLELYKAGTNDPMLRVGGPNVSDSPSITVHNNNGVNSLSLFVAGGDSSFVNGTVQGDTGVRRPNTGKFHIGTSASSQLVIDSAGNVGIGTSDPRGKLHTAGNLLVDGKIEASPGMNWLSTYILPGNSFGIPKAGMGMNLDWGTDFGADWVTLPSELGNAAAAVMTDLTTGAINFYTLPSVPPLGRILTDNELESLYKRMTITGEGNVGIGTATPTQRLHVVGNLLVQGTGGTCLLGQASGAINCNSDIRLKDHIQPIPDVLDKISLLRGVEFKWNERSLYAGKHAIGVIAQEVEKVFPSAVITDDSSGYKMVDYAVLVAPLIEGMKALKAENDTLKAKTQATEDKLNRLLNLLCKTQGRVEYCE